MQLRRYYFGGASVAMLMDWYWEEIEEEEEEHGVIDNDLVRFRKQKADYNYIQRRRSTINYLLDFLGFSKPNQIELRKLQVEEIFDICFKIKDGLEVIGRNHSLGITRHARFKSKPFKLTIDLHAASSLYIYCRLHGFGISPSELLWALQQLGQREYSAVYVSSYLLACHNAYLAATDPKANVILADLLTPENEDEKVTFTGGEDLYDLASFQFEPHMYLDRWFARLDLPAHSQRQIFDMFHGIIKFMQKIMIPNSQVYMISLCALSIALITYLQRLTENHGDFSGFPNVLMNCKSDPMKILEYTSTYVTGGLSLSTMQKLFKKFTSSLFDLCTEILPFRCPRERITQIFHIVVPKLSLLVDYKLRTKNDILQIPQSFLESQKKRMFKLFRIKTAMERIDRINPNIVGRLFRNALLGEIETTGNSCNFDQTAVIKIDEFEILAIEQKILDGCTLEEILNRKSN